MQFIKLFTPIFIAIFLILSDYKYAALDDIKQSINTLIKTPINFIVNQLTLLLINLLIFTNGLANKVLPKPKILYANVIIT